MQDLILCTGKCERALPTSAFRFDCKTMRYYRMCVDCERAWSRARKRKSNDNKFAVAWPECDLAIVREHYPLGGTGRCAPLLPHRNNPSIRAAAKRLGLTYEGPPVCGTKPNDHLAVPLPAPHDYGPEDRAWMTTRLPVFGGGFGVARVA